MSTTVGTRIQGLDLIDQVVALARIAQSRSDEDAFAPGDVNSLFDEFGLPRPAKVSNQLAALAKRGLLIRVIAGGVRGRWRLTPAGRTKSVSLATDMDLAALTAETVRRSMTYLAHTAHPVVPPSLAPPELVLPLHEFFDTHPFETNVFGMTRFPGSTEEDELDPISTALDATRDVCRKHGLTFHLASDRKIVDDLWPNVAAHLWGSQYGIAFFEDRTGKGLNYNLHIEVGSCLALGRRLAVLKDSPIEDLPTDLVGRIYHPIDLENVATVEAVLHRWIRDDLQLGPCPDCSP